MTRSPVIGLLVVAVCCSRTPAAAQEYRSVDTWCGGGVTGGGGGISLSRDGRIVHVRLDRAGAPPETVFVRRDTALARVVFRRLDEMRFLRIDHHQPSNMTCSLGVETDRGNHEVAWPINDKRAPRKVRELFQLIQKAAPP